MLRLRAIRPMKANHLLLCSLLLPAFFALLPLRASSQTQTSPDIILSCDALLGDYSFKKNDIELVLRIEKHDEDYFGRTRFADGTWSPVTTPMFVFPKNFELEDGKPIKDSCMLSSKDKSGGIVIVSLPPGRYAEDFETKTGFVLAGPEEGGIGSGDLVPLPSKKVVIPGPISGPPPMKTGLWESTITGRTAQLLAAADSTGRPSAKTEDDGSIVTLRSCMTAESWRPLRSNPEFCSRKNEQLIGKKYSVDIECTDNTSLSHIELNFDSDISGVSTRKMTYSPFGQLPTQSEVSLPLKFVSSDCGSIRPRHTQICRTTLGRMTCSVE
jgi:hypothetical protein